MTREDLQEHALELIKHNRRVALQWGTGLGKSRAAIEMANYLTDTYKKPIKILLVVAEVAHKQNWLIEFRKWNLKSYNITIECYASLKKYRNSHWDLIIFDEAHHLGSDLRMEIIEEFDARHIILLSATLPDAIMQGLTEVFGNFKSSKITLKDAIDWKILPKPQVYLIPLELDNTTCNCCITEEWGRADKRVTYKCSYNERWEYMKDRVKYPNVTLQIQCTQRQKYNYLSEQFEYWKKRFMRTRNEIIKNKWLQAGSKRKRFLGECKTRPAYELLAKLGDKRFICFCTSIEQVELLGGRNAIHSKRNDSLRVINNFNNKKINNIFAVGMLQEGQNLTDIEVGVIVQLDGQERAFIQKFGRSMRAENPIQYIFYFKDTKDEDYLKNILEGIDNEYIEEL